MGSKPLWKTEEANLGPLCCTGEAVKRDLSKGQMQNYWLC